MAERGALPRSLLAAESGDSPSKLALSKSEGIFPPFFQSNTKMDVSNIESDKNASSETSTLTTVAPSKGVNAALGADALLFRTTETRTAGEGVNVPSDTDALNPVGMDTDSSVRSTVPDAQADDQSPMTEVVNKRREKRQRQKERKRLERAMEGISISGEKGAKEKTDKAGTSGATSKPVRKNHPSNEESRKRERIAGDTPEMALKKRRLYSQAARKAITLRIVCKDDSRDITSVDSDFITSIIDDRIIDGSITTCRVHKTVLQPNGLNIACEDQETVDVLKTLINDLPGPEENHPGYHAMAPGDRPPMKRFFAWFPGNRSPKDNIKLLDACNKGLDVKKIAIKAVIPGDGGNTLVLGVEHELMDYLEAQNFKLFCGARGCVQLKEPRQQEKSIPSPRDPPKKQLTEERETEKESEPELSLEALEKTPE